jgi:hypothetical protein
MDRRSTAGGQVAVTFAPDDRAVALTVLIVWICVAVPMVVVFAAIGKSGLREEAARDRLQSPVRSDPATARRTVRVRPLAAEDAW